MFEQNPRIWGLGPQNTRVLQINGLFDISDRLGKCDKFKKNVDVESREVDSVRKYRKEA